MPDVTPAIKGNLYVSEHGRKSHPARPMTEGKSNSIHQQETPTWRIIPIYVRRRRSSSIAVA